HTVAAAERRRRGELREQHAAAVTVSSRRQGELAAACTRVEEFARDVGLPASPGELADVRAGVAEYRLALAGLWPAAEAWRGTAQAADDASAELTESRGRMEDADEAAATARDGASAAQATYEELRETAGAAVEELHRRLEEVRSEAGQRDAAERAARGREQHSLEKRGKAEGERGRLGQQIDDATRTRDAAVAEFQSFAATALLRVALPSLEI